MRNLTTSYYFHGLFQDLTGRPRVLAINEGVE